MAKSSPPCVHEAYLEQFQRDFSLFLSLRDEELVSGGCMFLILVGRSIADPSSKDCCYLWELLTKSLLQLVDEVVTRYSYYYSNSSHHGALCYDSSLYFEQLYLNKKMIKKDDKN